MTDNLLIQWLDIENVHPYERNPRKRSDTELDKLCRSLREYGWRQPIVTDKEHVIIVGHGRRLAALQLVAMNDEEYLARYGRKVPVNIADELSAEQVRAYRIADNRIHEDSGWDDSLLIGELEALLDMEFDLADTGFEDDQLRSLLGQIVEGDLPVLPQGDKDPFQQMTFTLHTSQVAVVAAALVRAKAAGAFEGSQNENSNGNALTRVCERYMEKQKEAAPDEADVHGS